MNVNMDVVATVDVEVRLVDERKCSRIEIAGNFAGSPADNPGMLSFQRLDVYKAAIRFAALTIAIVEELPRGNHERADQLSRAAESVIRNIAEGAGRWSAADSAKHHKIARGEAMECVGSLDILRLRRLVDTEQYERGIEVLEAVVSMLTKMV